MKKLIVGNWKCNPTTLKEAEELFDKVVENVKNVQNVQVVICPPVPFINNLKSDNPNIILGAQDCFWQEKGAFTGEVSPKMLKDLGVEYVILGHSERRKHMGETDEIVNRKVKTTMEAGLKPILCIGETAEERESGQTNEILKKQLEKGLDSLNFKSDNFNLIVAYEPVWAIGTGNSCDINTAKDTLGFIREMIKTPVLYGGSVDSKNASGYIKDAGFDGLLVGAASLKAEEFIRIISEI